MVKTREEALAEAKKLREMKPKVRQFSFFNDDNWAQIDAQIKVLEDDMDEDDIYGNEWDQGEESAAMSTRLWMDGEDNFPPSDDWEDLV